MLAPVTQAPPTFGATFGTGLPGVPICQQPTVVLNHTLQDGESHAVLHHFWATGSQYKIDRMWVEYYLDGDAEPSISFQPAFSCGQAFPERMDKDEEYAAGGLCGKTAPVGGWWNSYNVPFYKNAVVTVRGDPKDGPDCFTGFVNIRGTPGLPLVVPGSGFPLPNGTKLVYQSTPMQTRQPLEYVTIASLPPGKSGMVLQSSWAVEAANAGGPFAGGGYIEGCWQFYRQSDEPFPGLVVGTGVEDYFDSGYYFGADSGDKLGTKFKTPFAGLTHFERDSHDGTERLSAYRFHARDPLVMSDGGKLVWRVGAQAEAGKTKCGNSLPPRPPGEYREGEQTPKSHQSKRKLRTLSAGEFMPRKMSSGRRNAVLRLSPTPILSPLQST